MSEFVSDEQEIYLLDLINKEFPKLALQDCQEILSDILEGFEYLDKEFNKMIDWVQNHVYLYSFEELVDGFSDEYENALKECKGLDKDIYEINLWDHFRSSIAERYCCLLYKAETVDDCYIYID